MGWQRETYAQQRRDAIEDIIACVKEAKEKIEAGEFGDVGQARIIEQLSLLAFMPWPYSMKNKMIFQGQMKALEMLGKHYGMFIERLDINDHHDLAMELKEGWNRVEAARKKLLETN